MNEPRSRLARFASIAGLLVLGSVLGWLVAKHDWDPLPPIREQHDELARTGTVIIAIRNLAKLESVSFHLERVIDLKNRQSHLFGLLQGDDAILLVAAGDVIAGIDLTKMQDGDVTIDEKNHRAQLTLPPPELLSVRIDNDRTYVHSRKTDFFAQQQIELETRARQAAEESIRDAAISGGILNRARINAASTLTALVRSLGYDEVSVSWRGE
ncbi:MAG TPA: DUF4230 domain-containing protein [Polyangiales bacterium]|nr:DUF4230 domain-containing protein [Polyangiales bacterium]